MNLYITRNYGSENKRNAGAKAPEDINLLCKELDWQEYQMTFPDKNARKYKKLIGLLFSCPKQWLDIGRKKSSYILYQHPMYFGTKAAVLCIPFIKKIYHSKIIVLLHDLESLRSADSAPTKFTDIQLAKISDYVICHNSKMKAYLISKGIAEEKLIELKIFDYLCNEKKESIRTTPIKNSVAIAGNLSPDKCGYIYKFIKDNPTLHIDLYGANYVKKKEFSNAEYHGSFSPEKLPSEITSAFGLVWDGSESTTCSGVFGEYLKYNNPHKLSLYMSAGIPVITWEKAAIADFVKEHQVGIVVDSLMELSSVLNEITEEQYAKMKINAEMIGEKLRSGFYFRKALREIFDIETAKDKTRSVEK